MALVGALLFPAFSLMPTAVHAACTGASPTWSCPADANLASLKALIAGTSIQEGDTVNVAAGSVMLATHLTITNKSFSLIGAGVGNTIIDPQEAVTGATPCGIDWLTHNTGGSPAGFARLSGFTFNSTANCVLGASDSAMIQFRGTSHNVRIDHNWMHAPNAQLVTIHDDVRGVGDHNTFTMTTGGPIRHMTVCTHKTWGAPGTDYGDASWGTPSSWGSANAWYWEDNVFDNQMVSLNGSLAGLYGTDEFGGCRVVYRFNRLHNTSLQTHGTESSGRIRGYRQYEGYRNTWTWDYPVSWPGVMAHRGGSFRDFDNAVTVLSGPGLNHMIDSNVYRRGTDPKPNYYTFGLCGVLTTITSLTRSGAVATAVTSSEHGIHPSGSYVRITGASDDNFNQPFAQGTRIDATHFSYPVADTGTTTAAGTPVLTSPFDGNTSSAGYRCTDQVGAGQSTLYSGAYAVMTPKIAANNALEPAYIFHNLKNGVLSPHAPTQYGADVIVNLRDYYNENSTFNGTTQHGVGRGLRASRPSNCADGDAWWAMDGGGNWNTSTTETASAAVGYASGADGALDHCSPANTWTNNWYVPYAYPHPLVSDALPPAAPKRLRTQ
jgi:hypothetical protein